jgi:ferric-dicitrate binding protein FerR (iron transport regulator)
VRENSNHIDDLIGKYLAGEATGDEIAFIESWVAASESNRMYFNQVKTIFEKAASVTTLQEFNTDAAWTKVRAQLHKKAQGKAVRFEPDTNNRKLFWRIAASVIIVLGIGLFLYKNYSPTKEKTLEVITEKQTETDTLPDGSNVVLNKESKLAYSYNKKKKEHVVKLKGEAYFNVKHKDDQIFLVDIDGIYIKDIGTAFNVKAYPESNLIEVVVEEGEVMFYTDSDSGIYLQANGKGVYNKLTRQFTVEQPEPNVAAYKTRFFIFSDTDLASVVQALNQVYDKKISLGPNIGTCRLTVTFNNESIEEIAAIIAETLSLQLTNSGSNITLEGPGCNQ